MADIIWNRACLQEVAGLAAGDRALDGDDPRTLMMNGGVLHSRVALDPVGLAAGFEEAFRYFGLARVAAC